MNQGHGDFQSPALPTELSEQDYSVLAYPAEERKRFFHPDKKWWAIRDLNPGPTGYEPGALTAELMAHIGQPRLLWSE